MNSKILLVDDDRNMLATTERILRNKFDVETAQGSAAALVKINSSGPYAVIVADRQMPEMDGVQLLNKVKELSPDTVRLMLTGNAELESVIRVVNESNIFRFLTKPCPTNLLTKALEDALKLHQLVVSEKELLNKTLNGSIKLLTDILSMVEAPSFGDSQTLRDAITNATARLGLDNAWEIHLAAMLAPIGNVTVPPETLVRARAGQPLSKAEEQMLAHTPESAARLLANIPRLEGVAQIVRYQNKAFDGSGMPQDTVTGTAIPAGARLLKIITDFMDLQRAGKPQAEVFEAMRARQGRYDLALLTAFQKSFDGQASVRVSAARSTAAVTAKDLTTGMILRSNVETKDGILIMRAGHQINGMTLEKILNFASVVGVKEPIMVEAIDTPVVAA
jgi:response regulator RpfG family c-di-GMP phosphodiesterase